MTAGGASHVAQSLIPLEGWGVGKTGSELPQLEQRTRTSASFLAMCEGI